MPGSRQRHNDSGVIHSVDYKSSVQIPSTSHAVHGGGEPESLDFAGKNGADNRVRTRDPLITNQVLYQLSYTGTRAGI